jgi:hypothetical protein
MKGNFFWFCAFWYVRFGLDPDLNNSNSNQLQSAYGPTMQTKSQRTDSENTRTLRDSQIFRILSWKRARFLTFLTIQTQTLAKKSQIWMQDESKFRFGIFLIFVSHNYNYVLHSMYSTNIFFTISLLLPGTWKWISVSSIPCIRQTNNTY